MRGTLRQKFGLTCFLTVVVATVMAVPTPQKGDHATTTTVAEATTTVTENAVLTSGCLIVKHRRVGTRPALKPARHDIFPAITNFPKSWVSMADDPVGVNGWFSVVWNVTDRLPGTQAEWNAWNTNVRKHIIARKQAILERREQLVQASRDDLDRMIHQLYIVKLLLRDKNVFTDKLLLTLRDAALSNRIATIKENALPMFEKLEQARDDLARSCAQSTASTMVQLPAADVLLPAPSLWSIVLTFNDLVKSQRFVDLSEMAMTVAEIKQCEMLLYPSYPTIGMFEPLNPNVHPPFVPYDTPLPIMDTTLPTASPSMPEMKSPQHNWVEAVTRNNSAKVIAQSAGKVIFAERLSGTGVVVVIEHTDNLYTVYSYLVQTVVTNDQKVNKGDVIGIVGALPGGKTGVRFEVRKNAQQTTVSELKDFGKKEDLLSY